MLCRKFEEAIEAFVQFLKYEDTSDEICCLIADCYVQLHDYYMAFDFYQKAITFCKKNDHAWFGSGLVMKLKNDFHGAYKYFKKALILDDKNSEYWYSLGKVCDKLDLFTETYQAYEKACQLAPEKLIFWETFNEFLYDKGPILSAISVLNSALEYHPNNATFHYRLSAYYLELFSEKHAIKHLQKALLVDSKRHNYLFELFPEAKFNDSVVNLIAQHVNPGV